MTTGYTLHPRQTTLVPIDAIHETRIDAQSKEQFQLLAKARGLSLRAALTQLVEQHAEIREPFHGAIKRSRKVGQEWRGRYTEMLPEIHVSPGVGLTLLIDANRAGIRVTEAMRQLVWRCIHVSRQLAGHTR